MKATDCKGAHGSAHAATIEFEQQRVEYFRRSGVVMSPHPFWDSRGRPIYAMENRAEGPPIIVIHGGGDDASEWATLLARLPGHFRFIVVDRPGYGLSFRLDYRGVDVRQAAVEFVEGVLDALCLPKAVFLTISMGSFFSLSFALANPSRAEKLILVGAPAGVDRHLPLFVRLLGCPGINRALFASMRRAMPELMRERVYRPLLVSRPNDLPPDFLELAAKSWQLPGTAQSWRTLLQGVTSLFGFRRRYLLRQAVASLPVATWFIWGQRDAFAPPESGAELARLMPLAQMRTVAGAGHLPWFDEPEQCGALVGEALASRNRVGSVH